MRRSPRLRSIAQMIVLVAAVGRAAELSWHRRTLRQPAPDGYVAVVALTVPKSGEVVAALACVAEKARLEVRRESWSVAVGGQEVASGKLPSGPPGLLARRTPGALVLGANGQWLHALAVKGATARSQVLVGTGPSVAVRSFTLVARGPIRFADDFPDPVPRTGVWQPVQGSWALSSLSFPGRSANPAELAAVFDKPDDVASRGRTRRVEIGIGALLGVGASGIQIAQIAPDSPAERAGLREGDTILAVDGKPVDTILDALSLLGGKAGTEMKLKIERIGETKTVSVRCEMVVWGKTRRYVPILPATDDKAALIVAGRDFWADYHLSASVRTYRPGSFGLVFAYLDPDNYHIFRWRSCRLLGGGRLTLERVRDGQHHVLASRQGDFNPADFYSMAVHLEGDVPGKVRVDCMVDGAAMLSAGDDALVPGRVGLWAEAPGTTFFDDVVVASRPDLIPDFHGAVRSIEQLEDRTMRTWADPAYQWVHSGLVWWHKAPFYGDVAMSSPVSSEGPTRQVICAATHDPAAGYQFVLDPTAGTSELSRAGKVVARKALAKGRTPKRLGLSRRGDRLRVLFDGEPWMEFRDPKPLGGLLVGVACPSLREVSVASPNVYEDYFAGCPTEWHAVGGHWEVMNRWVCDPRWSFFGGRNDEGLVAIWSKRRLDGDCALDADVGVMMMELNTRYENMRDVGVSICAENDDVVSGYALLVGAEGNSRTLLFRRGKLVASTSASSALLPRARMGLDELHTQHRGWFHIRLEKQGGTVRFYLWDRLALTYEDPEPLSGGHAALWTVRNGILVAKARLAAERLSPPKPQFRAVSPFADETLTNDCPGGETVVSRDGSAYTLTNAIGGGPFAVALRPRVFSAYDLPRLSFDIKLARGARVDLYFTCHETLCRVVLSGPVDPVQAAETLKVLPDVKADGRWHHVSIDLLAELRKLYPDDKLLVVWEPTLGNLSNHGYLLAGVGGNRAGATYSLRNVELGPPPALAKADDAAPGSAQ